MTTGQVAWSWASQRLRHVGSRAALERYQERLVRRLLAEVRPRSAFYRDRLTDNTLDALCSMPPIDKAAMMANFDALNTVGISRDEAMRVALAGEASRDFSLKIGNVTVGTSSGTSGNRGLFLVSDAERAAWAGTILAKSLSGVGLGMRHHRIAFFLRANSNLYETLGSGRVRFEFFSLLDPLDAHLARLRALAPTVLVGPPSMLLELAAAQNRGVIELRLARVVSVAEVLDPLDEAVIRRAFRQTVHQIYQATEGLLATTCRFGTLHLAEDLTLFDRESLDDKRRFVPIVTDLYRRTQPIIRYRLNDVLVEREHPCLCGSVLTGLERVEGRSDDVFVVRTSNGATRALYPDFIRRAVITSDETIRAYHVWQKGFATLDVWVDVDGDVEVTRARVLTGLQRLFESMGAASPNVRFVGQPDRQPERKLRRVERVFQPDPSDMPEGLRR
jgi:putative adenylate-forming enzyme